jgi:two-component system LytT family response regulator
MKKGKFFIRTRQGALIINANDIIYCKAARRYTLLITQQNMMKIASNIKNIECRLCKTKFCRVHRSYIVNQEYIKYYLPESNEVLLKTGDKLSISLRKRNIFLKWLKNKDE